MSLEIRTQVGYEQLERLESVSRIPVRGTSIPGSIVIVIDGNVLIDHEFWDDIPDLWMDFVSGASRVLRSGSGCVIWPDQPTELHFDTFDSGSTPYLKLWLEVAREPVEGREAFAPAAEFFSALAHAATEFFDRYEELEPDYVTEFAYSRQLIQAWFDQGLVERTGS